MASSIRYWNIYWQGKNSGSEWMHRVIWIILLWVHWKN